MDKKSVIARAALQTFQEQGIEKTKISDIVKRAGVAQGTYYLYFPSKLAVMPAIAELMVEKLLDSVQDTVQEKAPLSKKLEQLVQAVFHITDEYHEVQALIYAGLASTEHIKEWERVYEPFYDWVRSLLQTAKENNEIRNNIDPHAASKLVIALVESAAEQIYLYDTTGIDQSKQQERAVLDFLQHALGVTS
ncbi:TetR/AcrR family transcriptional regulator [Ornithinibacillus gellani]|uniref:TetR family transcriptional regulator n=1 Tax=Ornithinibacillus gellani TaxID=2293253 RepID=UPI000F4AF5D5|nr:TetR family transcriptional regulator [Ornithinibacillus gellani]TQS71033.1 TetR/AcrR family transcriptional regulator [Ornithinibacillus gellani]